MKTSDFQFFLPDHLVAARAAEPRDSARLLVLDRRTGVRQHAIFHQIGAHLPPRALLVLNDTAVFPARLRGHKPTGGKVELLLTRRTAEAAAEEEWEALGRGLAATPIGTLLRFPGGLTGALLERGERGSVRVVLRAGAEGVAEIDLSSRSVWAAIQRVGEVPLPPYIEAARRRNGALPPSGATAEPGGDPTSDGSSPPPPIALGGDTPPSDRARYQTVYARAPGAVAAPTAGLHFTEALLADLTAAGHEIVFVTLHVGPGTFRPVEVEEIEQHRMDPEWYTISPAAAAAIEAARAAGRPIVAVGTTAVRTLESAARAGGSGSDAVVRAGTGRSDLFLFPGASFSVVTDLVTNFHLPRSTLLMLVAAFAGRENVLDAYAEAIARGYRFYSYGDAMLIRGTTP